MKRTLLALTALLPLAVGCGGDATGANGMARAALTGSSIGTGPVAPISGGWAPIPLYPATGFHVTKTTTNSVTLTWNEHGGNGETILYRQLYDLAGNPLGSQQVIHSWTSLAAGSMSVTDSDNPVAKSTLLSTSGLGVDFQPIQPDRRIGYQLVEVAGGYSDCEYDHSGYTCASSSTDAYTKGAVPYGASRIQLRIHVAQATAGASNLHVQVELSPNNATWLDSTQNDFAVGSNLTYDLLTDGIDQRSDILSLALWTPDSDGVCIDDLELMVDDATTFHQSFSSCRWVRGGNESIDIPFAALRSSADWQAYNPHDYSLDHSLLTFVGFTGEGLTSDLDATMGSKLRDGIPAPAYGKDAKLGRQTTITRTDATHLHVQQHLVKLQVTWKGIDLGTVDADPSYDLVIHHADPVCADWCLRVENPQGNSNSGWANDFLDALTLGVLAVIHGQVNGRLQDALSKISRSLPIPPDSPFQLGYCFAPTLPPEHGDPVPVEPLFYEHGASSPFDYGSLTVCVYPGN